MVTPFRMRRRGQRRHGAASCPLGPHPRVLSLLAAYGIRRRPTFGGPTHEKYPSDPGGTPGPPRPLPRSDDPLPSACRRDHNVGREVAPATCPRWLDRAMTEIDLIVS